MHKLKKIQKTLSFARSKVTPTSPPALTVSLTDTPISSEDEKGRLILNKNTANLTDADKAQIALLQPKILQISVRDLKANQAGIQIYTASASKIYYVLAYQGSRTPNYTEIIN